MRMEFTTVAILGNIILLFCICSSIYLLFECIRENQVLKLLAEALKKGEKQRRVTEEEYAIMYGNKEKYNWLYSFDLMLEQSGIKAWSKYITTESVGVVIFLLVLFVFIVVTILASSMFLGVACVVCTIFILFSVLNIFIDIRYKRIEQSMIKLFNIMENNSKHTDDVVTIIGKTYPYMSEPLRSCMKRCYDEAILTGDVSAAFRKAELSSPHEKFRDFLRNIEMCSRHTCNYVEIIRDSKKSFKAYVKGKNKRRALVLNETGELFILIGICLLFVGILKTQLNIDMFYMLFNTLVGKGMLAYWLVTLGYGAYSIIKASRR